MEHRFAFEFEIGRAEQVRASRVMTHRQRSTRLTYGFMVVVLPLLGAIRIMLSDGRETVFETAAIVIPAVLAGSAFLYFSPNLTVRNIRKNNRAAAGPHIYRLSDGGIQTTSPGTVTTSEWPNISEAYESTEFLLFYVSKGFALLLPKRVVGQQDLPRLRDALRQWLGERAKTL